MVRIHTRELLLVCVGILTLGIVYLFFEISNIADISNFIFFTSLSMLIIIGAVIKEFSIFSFSRIKVAMLLYWAIGYYVTPLYFLYRGENIDNVQFVYAMLIASVGILSFILGNSFTFQTVNTPSQKSQITNLLNNIPALFLTILILFVVTTIIRVLFVNLGIYSSLFSGGLKNLPISLTIYNALMPFLSINFLTVPLISWLYFSNKIGKKQKIILLLMYFTEVIFSFLTLQRFPVIYTLFTPILVGALINKVRLKFIHFFILFIFILVFFYLNNKIRLYLLLLSGYKYDIQLNFRDFIDTLQGFKDYGELSTDSKLEIVDAFFYRFFDNCYKNLLAIIEKEGDFKLGSTYLFVFYNFIPRFIWPNKPEFQLSYDFGLEYGIINSNETVAITVSRIGEAFMNFGIVGVMVILFIWGIVAKVIEESLSKHILWLYIFFLVNFIIAETFFTNVFSIVFKQLVYFSIFFILSLLILELLKVLSHRKIPLHESRINN